MCVDIGGGSHFRERGVHRGVHENGGSQGGSQKGGPREPYEPPGYGPGFYCIRIQQVIEFTDSCGAQYKSKLSFTEHFFCTESS